MAPVEAQHHFDAILGAIALLFATGLAWLLALRSSIALKRSEVTSQLIRTWFSVEHGKVRLEMFEVIRKIYHEEDYSDLDWLINRDLKTYTDKLPGAPALNGIAPAQNVLIFLYYFVEVTANYEMGLLDRKVFEKVFCSQYEFWRPLLRKIRRHYFKVLETAKVQDDERVRVVPPWIENLPILATIMGRPRDDFEPESSRARVSR